MQENRQGFEWANLFLKSAVAAAGNWKINTCWEQTYSSIKEKRCPDNKSTEAL